jgi:hypothetical protein
MLAFHITVRNREMFGEDEDAMGSLIKQLPSLSNLTEMMC